MNKMFIVLGGLVFLGALYYFASVHEFGEFTPDQASIKMDKKPQETSSGKDSEAAKESASKPQDMDNTSKSQTSMDKLLIETIKEGSGETVTKKGDTISVHYTGTLLDGTKFDSSVDRGEPFSFTLGAGQVIRGWDEGLLGMKIGEKRKLTIPSEMGYGSRGAGAAIPPNSVLIFETELIGIE